MGNPQKPIVVAGSINIDFVVTTDRIPLPGETVRGSDLRLHHGGKGANQAVAAARLGWPLCMIGMVGSDVFGQQLRSGLEAAQVDVRAVGTTDGSSGVATITVSRAGENAIVVSPGANARVTPAYLETHRELIRDAGIVLAQLEIPIESVEFLSELCSRYGVPLILDPAPAQDLPPGLLSRVRWFTPNETEAAFYAERIDPALAGADPARLAAAFLRLGVASVALKLGERGVLLASADGSSELLPAVAVKAVDSTAAGDAFNGAFAAGLMLGMEPCQAGRFACAAAAVSVTRHGAQPSMPDRAEVERLLHSLEHDG
jgi:ribokinase